MSPSIRLATSRLNEHRTVFHGEELTLFFCDGSSHHEDDINFYNENFMMLPNEEHDISEEHFFQETSDWLFLENIVSLVLHSLFILWTRLNDTIGRYFE